MLNRLTRARIPLHQLVQPPPSKGCSCSTASHVSQKGKEREQIPTVRSGRTTRSIDWSQPSTSAIPYSPTLSRFHSTSASATTIQRTEDQTPPATFEDLLAETSPRVPISTLLRSFSHSLPTLSRSTFDLLFDRLSASTSNASTYLRQVKSMVEKEKGWKLNERQLRAVLKASLFREREHRIKALIAEQNEARGKGKEKVDEPVEDSTKEEEEERAIWAQRRRQNVSDALFKEYLALVSKPKKIHKSQHQAIAEVLELFARCAAIRPVSTTRDQDGQSILAFSLSLDYSKRSEETIVIENDIAGVIRRLFANQRDEEAMAILRKMAEKRRVLTVKAMRDLVRDHYEGQASAMKEVTEQPLHDAELLTRFDKTPESSSSQFKLDTTNNDEYSHARKVLDQVCTSTSSTGLDELLRLRLERVDRLEELEKNPRGAFLKWLSVKAGDRPEWLEMTLKIWEAGIEKGEDGENFVRKSYRKVLEDIVVKACQVGKIRTERPGEQPLESSPLIDFAVNLAIDHFPLQVLIHHSHTLLSALTVDSHSPDLASYLFDVINSPSIDFAYAPFQWSATLLTSFTRLFFSSQRYEKDPSLPVRLYLSWTSSGLTFPTGLWDPFWRSLGHGGNIDDLERVLQDWEETGRGPASSRIVRQVLQGAFNSGNVPRSLELFEFFRSRYAPTSLHEPQEPLPAFRRTYLHPLVVPVESYNALFTLLAHSRTDYQKTLSTLFSSFIFDGHSPSTETYNALLASKLLLTKFKVSDVDSAGVIYNKLVQTGLKPDRDTFGLLMHGFNRMALEGGGGRAKGKEKLIGIEASLRTFKASLANSNLGNIAASSKSKKRKEGQEKEVQTLARGQSVAGLMKILAKEGRFEDAKEVGEEWWRALIWLEEVVGSKGFWEGREIKDECSEMRKAAAEVGKLERESSKVELVEER
ncbi:uncharacterized protein JCM6883_001033 [Sporobolomyces salmoneus]|uniref:uncharacterized protein n=1 Tax=Sporobolomyces salmoneus TaxID=183962 RepID=UPI00318285D1